VVIRMKRYLLTTVDNPYHPIDELEQWLAFDEEHGYYTNQRIAKVHQHSLHLTDAENQRIVNGIIDDFIRLDETGLYKKIVIEEP